MEYTKENLSILDMQLLESYKSDFEKHLKLSNKLNLHGSDKNFKNLINTIDSILAERR
jgi:hypothetical protein